MMKTISSLFPLLLSWFLIIIWYSLLSFDGIRWKWDNVRWLSMLHIEIAVHSCVQIQTCTQLFSRWQKHTTMPFCTKICTWSVAHRHFLVGNRISIGLLIVISFYMQVFLLFHSISFYFIQFDCRYWAEEYRDAHCMKWISGER